MSSVLRPVGPESPGTYWLRRLLLVGLLVLLALLVAHACGGSGAPSRARTAAVTPPSTRPTLVATSQSPPPTVQPCPAAVLSVGLSTDSPQYTAGQTPKFTATIRNTGGQPCRLVTGPSRQTWRVTSGQDQIWTTRGCARSPHLTKLTLKRHAARAVSVFWDGRRHDSTCVAGARAAAGTYVVSATVNGLAATPVVFRLTS